MPDVGVLELTIRDNSTTAAGGLTQLSDALRAVKRACNSGLGLDKVASEVVNLAKTIQAAKGTSTIVKNLGTMFNAINKFSKLKGFNLNADELRDYARSFSQTAESLERMNKAKEAAAGDKNLFDTMIGGGQEKAANTIKKTVDTFEEQYARLSEVTGGWKTIMRMHLFDSGATSRGTSVDTKTDVDELQKQAEELVQTKEVVQEATEAISSFKNEVVSTQGPVKALDLDKYISTPLDSIRNKAAIAGTEIKNLGDTLSHQSPMLSVSAMEKAVAGNAELAKKEISSIIKTLNTPIKYKGLSEFIDVKTGVTGSSQGQNIINESTTMLGALVEQQEALAKTTEAIEKVYDSQTKLNNAGEALNGTISIYDALEGKNKAIYVDMSELVEKTAEEKETIVDMTAAAQTAADLMASIPASGKNGMFASAAEEAKYLSDQLAKSEADMQRWSEIYQKAVTQMKYGGPRSKEDLAFDLKYAEEGYYAAVESADRYKASINELSDYMTEAAHNARQMAQDLEAQAASTEHVADAEEKVKNTVEEVTASATPAISKIELIRNKINELMKQIVLLKSMPAVDELGKDTGVNNAINNKMIQIGKLYEELDRVVKKAHEAQDAMQFDNMKSAAAEGIAQRAQWTSEDVQNLVNNYSQVELLEMKMHGMEDALARDINANKLDQSAIADRTMAIQNLKDKIEELKQKQEETSESTSSLGISFKGFRKTLEAMFPTLTSLFKSFTRMAKMRAIRYVIRQIAAGFKEGTQNVYEYSKAIGSTFHTSMDSAASSLAQMKNALGAQLAPLLQMLIPVLQRVVNWFINVMNVANQFFSLLNGQKSWTRALPQTVSAFDKQTKATKSASAAMKDLLADWDELNIIQSESGGGGGGAGTTAAEDYLNMFEEVYTFDNKIKDTVQWVQDHMEEIKTVAEAIGLSIFGWKISEAFGLTLGTLQKLELIGGIILTIASIKLLASAAYDIGKDGINGQNALDAVAGVLGTMVGTTIAGFAIGGVVGAAIGLIVGAAISLAVTGINIREGKLDSLYGDVSKDVDDIRKELEENVLTADATMTVNVAQAKIKDVQDAETKVTDAINELNKTYPLGVEITPTNADDFIGKVNALVAADNELLQKSGEVLNLTVPASPQWGNEGDFHTFLDEALGDVSSYVTGIGEEIGKLISQGITKGTKLDELRKQLEEISVAILTAQKSSEFSAAVGIAGATARNMKQYDRKTIENYMTEYATLLQSKMGEAQAQATAEYVELQRTVAAYEELGKNNAEEYDPEVMKNLREELAAWDNGKRVNVRAQELVDEWTAVGKELYKNDILSLLSGNMIKNKNTGWRFSALHGSGAMSQEPINIINSYDDKRKREWADEYIEQGNKLLKDIIQSETGIKGDVVLNFANASGLSLLDFFDAGFAKEFEDSIVKVVSRIDIPQSEKERIYAAFGMDYNNYNVPKEIEEAIVKYSEGGLDTREINQILEHFDITNERLNRYIQILGYENLFGEHYYTERDDTGYLNPDEAEKAMRFIASAGSVSDVGWMPAQTYAPVAGNGALDMEAEVEGGLTEEDVARGTERGTDAAIGQVLSRMAGLLQVIANNSGHKYEPTSTAGAWIENSSALFKKIAHE